MSDSPPPSRIVLPQPPVSLLDGAALFLDFDGTLAPIADTPDGVAVDEELIGLLGELRDRLEGRLAIVSGRSIATLRDLGFAGFLLAGTHGLEMAQPGERVEAPPRRPAVDDAEAAFHAFAEGKPGILVERKSISVGLHFRGAPQWGAKAGELASDLAEKLDLSVQPGKMLFELRPGGADKGSAVHALMAREPMAGGRPVFIGDDVTDEEGFAAAAELGGAGILVGPPRETLAAFSLEQVAAVRHYLARGIARPR
ncbi:haloacid dehalogenase [Sphingobium quisquiliarum P25]|uniref:Trehalose 6-phosphate phosphatase n=1 Tax=Sphingobium quisquiliarum P25 TaxID=1329909 RepID=T0HTT7_9SPHN|nr:trehalose-phosphatase [Sphingobium quisquiliarum]EQB02715.1 haloacid dehalogenase [Sphingobium quisquiliarum P25]